MNKSSTAAVVSALVLGFLIGFATAFIATGASNWLWWKAFDTAVLLRLRDLGEPC